MLAIGFYFEANDSGRKPDCMSAKNACENAEAKIGIESFEFVPMTFSLGHEASLHAEEKKGDSFPVEISFIFPNGCFP